MNFTGTAPAGETWYWQTSATGTSTANSVSSYTVSVSGTYYVRSQDNTTFTWSSGAGSVTVVITPDVTVPVFTSGATSTRCQAAGTETYTATSSNTTGITYSLDATSLAYGNTINSTTGEVNYVSNWNGTSTITASAEGCGGPLTADHEVTITATVGTPAFVLGSTSTRCQGAGTVLYEASSSNATGIIYSLDAGSLAAGNTINATTGEVIYVADWSGTSLITAEASGCNGPKTESHTVTINPSVQTPVFTLGATSTRCKSSSSVTYTATAANNTGITYSLDPASISAGLTINTTTGAVNYNGGFIGTVIITANAKGCNGPIIATHTAITNDDVATPVFISGSSSTRCQGAGTFTYTAAATYASSIIYSLDAASATGGNTINTSTGLVTFTASWSGTTTITATAVGCNGPRTATHTVTITPSVSTPVFALGSTSSRCKSGGTVTYTANATNTTGITYSLDPASQAALLGINVNTGMVTYYGYWSGTTIITATAQGCNGPVTATHTVTIFNTIGTPVFTLGAASTRCQGAGTVNYTATSTGSTGITYSVDATTAAFPGNSFNTSTGAITFAAGWSGTSIITASASGCGGPITATHTVTTSPSVNTPVFALGATSSHCQGIASVTYSATATNNTGLTYSLDAASITGGNIINATTGAVTFNTTWIGTSTITVTAAGCNGPKTATHVVTITPSVNTPVFALGASSTRCWGFGILPYSATALNSTGITYSLDATSLSWGNTINAATGAVNWSLLWVGTSTITATATGCNGPKSTTHTVIVTGGVTNPVFTLGATSTRCQGAGTVIYDATGTNVDDMSYSLDAASITGGNTINPATGEVTYVATWSGTTVITATATGCGGPKTSNHTVTVTPTVSTPVFSAGATSTRCQGALTVTYTATATNSTSRTYSLDAASISGGNTINTLTGAVTYTTGWSGTSIITVFANGCNGPSATVTHTVTITPSVTTPVFTLGVATTRCQGAGTVLYDATAANNTGLTYSLNAASITGGNSINPATGLVTYAATWSGTSIITVSAAGCNGPKTATHTVTITPTVGTPVFLLGATTTRCQGANTVIYTAGATNNTGISYSLDAASITGNNTINATTGAVSYDAAWSGTSIITATATGCNGPKTFIHTVTITPTVGTPVFTLGSATTRCQGSSFQAYTATATTATAITYWLDAASIAGGNTINSTTGTVVYAAGWSGTTIITASAAGCNGPVTAIHTVTVTPTVGIPVFSLGATSTRCQGITTVTYIASASNSTAITYSLDATSIAAGNTINGTTGEVSYAAGWNGMSTITASATGCNGPKTANHTVTITSTVGTPVFTLGFESVRAQGTATITYSATATNNTGITYSLDAASLLAGNTINPATGAVTWVAGWFGASSITASANGCNGPVTSSHIVNTNPSIVQTPLYLADPGQLLDRVDPVATNIIPTAVSYPISSSATGVLLDATTTTTGTTASISLSHTTGTGANRFMLVGISQSNRTVTSVTYGSTALTLVGQENTNGNARVSIYQLINPPSGTASVTVNFSTANTNGAVISVTTYTGVNQTTALGAFVSTNAKTTNPTLNISSATGELVYDVVSTDLQSVTVGSGQTQKWNLNSGQRIIGAGSTKPGAASITMSWTAALTDWALGAVSIKPAPSQSAITFTQSPALCSDLIIKAQTIQMLVYVKVTSGTMPVNPAITANLKYGSTTFISLSNPVYNSASKILSWTGTLGADVTVPTGQAVALEITSAQAGVQFQIEYHSASKPSRISLLPVSTFIDFISFNVYNAPYPAGTIRTSGLVNTTYYARAVVTTPFGYKDITGMDLTINPLGSTVAVNCVDSSTCTRTYEYAWTTPNSTNMYFLMATAKEGYENLIKNSELVSFDICAVCPPIALNDSATGAGGAPIIVDVLANDNDPNNNMKVSSLAINIQPRNGSGYISNGKVIYLPNGTYAGKDTLVYQICDSTNACSTAYAYFTVNPLLIDPCSDATRTHTYFIPYPEQDAYTALVASSNQTIPSNNIRTVISLTMPYPGMTIVWDNWEDGYEINALNPVQATTKVWGDGNPYNGIAPGYANDIIPAAGSIILDNTMPANPRVQANIFFDGKDKITSSGQVSITQVCGEPTWMPVQAIKTNVTSTFDFGQSFTVPLGQNFPSQDFKYTALFVRAEYDSTVVQIDKDNNGTLETTFNLNQGQSFLVNGGVNYGATVTSNNPVGVELNAGGIDGYSIRNSPIYPATWYSNTYYSPVPTSDNSGDSPKDTSVVMFYNSLNRPLVINWYSGANPAGGIINLPAKTTVRYPLAYSTTSAYKFVNLTGESFTAIEIVDSYTPGGGGNDGQTYDWAFNLISESRLTDFATTAWAPGGLDLIAPPGPDVNGNPIWVTPSANTTIYVKWDGKVSGNTGLVSPGCGLRYDVSYNVNALNYIKLRDPSDNDQSGIAVYTCNGAKIAAVYGEDPQGSGTGIGVAYWDVGTTILPFCKQKLIFANDDYGRTMVNQPVTIPILINDFGFLAVVDPTTVSTTAVLQPKHGTVSINANGTIIYKPAAGYIGKDTFEYNVCSTPSPVVCDMATVYVDIAACPAPYNQNVIVGTVFIDKNDDGLNNDGGTGLAGPKVYLYVDGNCNSVIDTDELKDSVTVDASGSYQFVTYPEKTVEDDFDDASGNRTCNNGSDGSGAWLTDWVDAGDPSTGPGNAAFCVTPAQSQANTHAEIYKDGAFTNAIRLKNKNVSVTRRVNLSGASYAFLSFSYRRKSATLTAGEDVIVQASKDGTTFGTVFTIPGDGSIDANYVNIFNQDITQYAAATTYIRFLTNNNVDDGDTVYIDNVKLQFIRYPICYITKLDASTVPAYHHTTTALQQNFTATSAQTCLAPYDFGIAKNKLIISGTVYNDANGLTDNLINGTTLGTASGSTLYAYLVDSTGLVVRRTTVNTSTGNYSFTNGDVFTNYKLLISTTSVNIGDLPPTLADFSLASENWLSSGEAFGVNNAAGTGIKTGVANSSVDVKTTSLNVTNVNIGLNRLPNSDYKELHYYQNTPNTQYTLKSGIYGRLSGTDPEDGVLDSAKTYKITSLPFGAVLFYNGTAVTLNQVITNFNPLLLVIDPDDDILLTSFTYAARDAAGFWDPTPATFDITWIAALPVNLINFTGRLNGEKVDLNWSTTSEVNSNYFELERSTDGQVFTNVARVTAKGSAATVANYLQVDNAPEVGLNYYRLKIVDKNGSYTYSNVVVVKYNVSADVISNVKPNPFTNRIDIYIYLDNSKELMLNLYDVAGNMVYSKKVKGLKGANIVTVSDLAKLPKGTYLLKVITDNNIITEKLLKH
jgi:hypothetical protein